MAEIDDLKLRISRLEKSLDILARNTAVAHKQSSLTGIKEYVRRFTTTVHSELSGLLVDDHTQYPLLIGRAGGTTLNGGIASGEDIYIRSTTHATQGDVLLNDLGGNVGIGTAAPDTLLHICKADATAIMRMERNDTTIGTDDIVARIEVEGQDAGAAGVCVKLEAIGEGNAGETGWRFSTGIAGAATEVARLDYLGNLGLGVTAPDAQLHIENVTGAVQRLTRKDDTVTDGDIIGRIEFETQDASDPGVAAYIQGVAEGSTGEVGLALATGTSGAVVEQLRITNAGIFHITSLPSYANNAAAVGGGLAAGDLYRTGGDPDLVCIVH